MGLFQMRPSRAQAAIRDQDIVLDLDKLVSEPQAFRWRGRAHEIKPITTKTFFVLMNKIAGLDNLKGPDMTEAQFIDAYTEVFGSVCDTLHQKDVEDMTNPQRAALMTFILDCVKGRAQADGYVEKKKAVMTAQTPTA